MNAILGQASDTRVALPSRQSQTSTSYVFTVTSGMLLVPRSCWRSTRTAACYAGLQAGAGAEPPSTARLAHTSSLAQLSRSAASLSAPSWGLKRGHSTMCKAGAMDVMPEWTLDQIAGLVFGGVMVVFVLSAKQVDVWVARQQRRQLGLCEECGGLYEPGMCQQGKCPAQQGGSGGGTGGQR